MVLLDWKAQRYKHSLERIAYLDIAKGIGILLVIIGHLFESNIHTYIYLFHMPLFFFISGLLYRPNNKYLRRKTKYIIIPFFIFSIISFPIKYLERSCLQKHIYFNVSYLTPAFYNIPLWFCISLFTISCIYYIIDSKTNRHLKLLLCGTIIFIGIIFAELKIFLPIYLSQSLLAFPFYFLGVLLNKHNFRKTITNHKYLVIFFSICILLYSIHKDICTDISILIINRNPILYIAPAISGSFLVIIISIYILKWEQLKNINHILIYLGRKSLYIFALHWPFITILDYLLSRITNNNHYISFFTFIIIIIVPLSIGKILEKYIPSIFIKT